MALPHIKNNNTSRKTALLSVLLLACYFFGTVQLKAQHVFEFKKPARSHKISFSLHRNLIIIQAYLNNKGPYNFLLDTGVNRCILTDPRL
ncbi:MAG: hypothetical protein LPK19_01225, partial [Hymenobacteraceae bacterium]|nr:hypothetical protein [Hymenobacteraceae bacterium]MDX5394795.1 hypothetical protein [Hymenobacteraceae bacterium]